MTSVNKHDDQHPDQHICFNINFCMFLLVTLVRGKIRVGVKYMLLCTLSIMNMTRFFFKSFQNSMRRCLNYSSFQKLKSGNFGMKYLPLKENKKKWYAYSRGKN